MSSKKWEGVFPAVTTKFHANEELDYQAMEKHFAFQLAAFRDAITDRTPIVTDARNALATMQVVDSVYRAAGMEPRPRTTAAGPAD